MCVSPVKRFSLARIMGMRNHIAHGYFDINEDYVLSVIKNDLAPLLEAVEYLIEITDEYYLTA